MTVGTLAGKTLFITGASRGIGKCIALRAARDGANIVVAAKTAETHAKLPGTIYTAAKDIENVGGKCLPCIVDVREESQVEEAVDKAVKLFGGIDIVVNNASAINLQGTRELEMKRYDLMMDINTRGTYLVSKVCIPHLLKSPNPHILNISPPLNMAPHWFKNHVAYTMAKYGMSMCVLGMAEEFAEGGIAVNALWPKTAILTAAMEMLGGADVGSQCRKPEIMADAAYVILNKPSKSFTGKFAIDEEILKDEGVTNFEQYACVPGSTLLPDFFLDIHPDEVRKLVEAQAGSSSSPEKQSKTSSESDESLGDDAVAQVFKQIKGLCNTDLVKSVNAVYVFDLKEDGKYFIDLKNAEGSVGQGEPEARDTTMTLSTENFLKMFQGKLKPTVAFMSGKLKIKGDMGKAMKLEKLMGKMHAESKL